MDIGTTLTLAAMAAVLVGVSLWGVRRKRPIGEVTFVPWHGLLFVGLLSLCALVAHLVTLMTGVPLRGAGR